MQERKKETGEAKLYLPLHIFYDQIQLLQIFIFNQISAIFHHLQDVLLHGIYRKLKMQSFKQSQNNDSLRVCVHIVVFFLANEMTVKR